MINEFEYIHLEQAATIFSTFSKTWWNDLAKMLETLTHIYVMWSRKP